MLKRMIPVKHDKYLVSGLLLAILVLISSCHKKDDDPVYYYLSGALKFNSDAYIPQSAGGSWVPKAGETEGCYDFVPYGVRHPLEGGTVGYYFKVTPGMETSDTTLRLDGTYQFDKSGRFRYHFGDSLGTYRVYAYSFGSSSYIGSAHSAYVTVVKPGLDGSVKTVFSEDDELFTDPRDNNTYVVVNVGGTSWLKPNLAYGGTEESPLGIGYRGYDIMNGVFGRYYTWEEAQTACPEGWSLPSDEDWAAAASLCGGVSGEISAGLPWKGAAGGFIDRSVLFNDDKETLFWDYWPEVAADNSTGLSLLSTGFGSKSSKQFDGAQSLAVQWTSDETGDGSKGVYRYIRDSYADVYVGQADKTDFVANVRCIRK